MEVPHKVSQHSKRAYGEFSPLSNPWAALLDPVPEATLKKIYPFAQNQASRPGVGRAPKKDFIPGPRRDDYFPVQRPKGAGGLRSANRR